MAKLEFRRRKEVVDAIVDAFVESRIDLVDNEDGQTYEYCSPEIQEAARRRIPFEIGDYEYDYHLKLLVDGGFFIDNKPSEGLSMIGWDYYEEYVKMESDTVNYQTLKKRMSR
jgi:hypothetical protein